MRGTDNTSAASARSLSVACDTACSAAQDIPQSATLTTDQETAKNVTQDAIKDAVKNIPQNTATGAKRTYTSNKRAAQLLAGKSCGIMPDMSRPAYRAIKRAFDIIASGVAIIILFIPSVILSAVICTKSPGASPLYAQPRVGRVRKDGTYRLFKMYKFRSMVPHADEMLADLQRTNQADGPLFKMKDDPRIISGLGHFIRRHSIDELPQLINVFKGEMSLIGPRPALPAEVLSYTPRDMRRISVKPGCGGVWQTTSRSEASFGEMVDLDLTYIETRTLTRDLALVGKTIRAMFTGGGAY